MMVLSDLTWPEAERLAGATGVLAVPVGATEQHGPHLPLSTDTDIAVAICARLAARRPHVVIAPPVCYGSSGEHAGFAGTISVGQQVVEDTLVELGRSACATFRHLVFVSTHGGNDKPVLAATRTLRAESRDVLAWLATAAGAIGTRPGALPPGDAHAGRVETSIQLALDPRRVRLDRAEAGNRTPLAELMPTLRRIGVRPVSGNGVLGDPAGASAADGARLLDALTADLVHALDAWLGRAAQ